MRNAMDLYQKYEMAYRAVAALVATSRTCWTYARDVTPPGTSASRQTANLPAPTH